MHLVAVVSDYGVVVLWTLRGTVVVTQHAANPLVATNTSLAIHSPERLNQLVPDALMIPLGVVVGYKLGNHASQMSLPQRDHAREALLLDRPNKPLGIRVAVRRPERRPNDPNSLPVEKLQHATTPFPVAIADQHAIACNLWLPRTPYMLRLLSLRPFSDSLLS